MVSCVKAACITRTPQEKYRPPTNMLKADKKNECEEKKL
jgi:hypothetical protein